MKIEINNFKTSKRDKKQHHIFSSLFHDYKHHLGIGMFLDIIKANSKVNPNIVNELFKDLKHHCYDSINYKWSVKKTHLFITRKDINPKLFIDVTIELNRLYYEESSTLRGKKTANRFILVLKNSKKFNYTNYSYKGIRLKDDANLIEFLQSMKDANKHLNFSHRDMVKFIFTSFNTNISETTLKRYYFDKTI
jgi:hypothetical protein